MKQGTDKSRATAVALCAALFSGFLAGTDAFARDHHILLTGEVFSRKAQDIFVPHTSSWRTGIAMLAPEGELVQPGDVVVAFDGTATQRELENLDESRRSQLAVTDRDLARLEKELTQAEFALEQAEVTLELATMRADLPDGLIGAIEQSENQLAREQAEQDLEDAIELLKEKQDSLDARQNQAILDEQKYELQRQYAEGLLDRLSVEATQTGYVIHANHPRTRAKFQEGDTARTSYRVAEVADTSDLAIRIWVNGVDRPHIEAGSTVEITFDALPERPVNGTLESVSDSATKRLDWSKAAYFEGTVRFEDNGLAEMGLLPGMSALVEVMQ